MNDNEVRLVCKGTYDHMRDLMNLSNKELEIYDLINKQMISEGLKPIVYATKVLDILEAAHYYNELRNLKTSLLSQDEELKKLGRKIYHI